MKNEIRVWRCEESEAVVRALQNLQELSLGVKNTEIDEDEAEEEYEQTRYISATVKEGKTNGN